MARATEPNCALVTRTAAISSQEHVALCAPCHSRRAQLADHGRPGGELLDRYLPSLLSPGVFYADGQIQDEDFEYHAFTQSKMFASGVRCADCHDVHSGKRHEEGNGLCIRCHQAEVYDAPGHHFHRATWRGQPGPGSRCVSCHMPGQTYMGVHFRRDHSLRVPRPYASRATGAPDGCSAAGCHAEQPAGWVMEHFDRWYGKQRRPHYGSILAAGRAGAPEAEAGLLRLAQDARRPALARATALDLLGGHAGAASAGALERALADPDPLLRHTAASRLNAEPARLARALAPLLGDPVRAVRAEAAARLAGEPAGLLPQAQQKAQAAALEEYVASQRYLSDAPSGPLNLGNLYASLGRADEAERQFRRALEIDGQFHIAKVNLALLLAREGRAPEAERLLREVHTAQPQQADVALDLGLLLAEQGRGVEAEQAFRGALAVDPQLASAAYNLAVLLGERSARDAVPLAQRAAALAPEEPRYAWTVGYYQARAGDRAGAARTLEALLVRYPEDRDARELLGRVQAR